MTPTDVTRYFGFWYEYDLDLKCFEFQIVCIDVTEGGLGVSACRNNLLKVWETSSGAVRVCGNSVYLECKISSD